MACNSLPVLVPTHRCVLLGTEALIGCLSNDIRISSLRSVGAPTSVDKDVTHFEGATINEKT